MNLRANYHPEETTTTSTVLVKSVKVTIGYPGATGVDYAYTSAGDTTEQELEIVGVIPSMCKLIGLIARCTSNCNLALNTDVGSAGGLGDILTAANCDDLNDLLYTNNSAFDEFPVDMDVQSIFINSTPDANWDTMTSGLWELYITYIDNSLIE